MKTPQDSYWHRVYEAMTDGERNDIDILFETVQSSMWPVSRPRASDDRAECLVAALTRYVVESAGNAEIRAGLSSVIVPVNQLAEAVRICEETEEIIDNLSPERRAEINANLARDHAFLKGLGLRVSAHTPTI